MQSRSNPIVHRVILIAMNRRSRPMAKCVMLLGISFVKLLPIKHVKWEARLHGGYWGCRSGSGDYSDDGASVRPEEDSPMYKITSANRVNWTSM